MHQSEYPVISKAGFRWWVPVLVVIGILLAGAFWRLFQVVSASSLPPQGYLILGGSGTRELYSTQFAKSYPERKILISGGSPDPCLRLVYEMNGAPLGNVWTEHCSQNTFENFVYSVPILEKMGVRKVVLVTDYPQIERALPIAHIMFGSRGIAVEVDLVPQRLTDKKPLYEIIGLQVMACGWSIISQLYQPSCPSLTHLTDVDMDYWYRRGFECQPQTGVPSSEPK